MTSGWKEEGERDPKAMEQRVPRMEEDGTTEIREKGSEGKVLNLWQDLYRWPSGLSCHEKGRSQHAWG